ncbi:MAG: hypothetical protein P8J32_02910, partial [bacterium]|nr:hypothetical protein [bacterium]
MPPCKYTVDGKEYSKTSLQAEWRARCKKYAKGSGASGASNGTQKGKKTSKKSNKDSASRVAVSAKDQRWFVEAAWSSETHRKFLFGSNLNECYAKTGVVVDCVARAFNVR